MSEVCNLNATFKSYDDAMDCFRSFPQLEAEGDATLISMGPDGYYVKPELHIEKIEDGDSYKFTFASGLPKGCSSDADAVTYNSIFSDNQIRAEECRAALSISSWFIHDIEVDRDYAFGLLYMFAFLTDGFINYPWKVSMPDFPRYVDP